MQWILLAANGDGLHWGWLAGGGAFLTAIGGLFGYAFNFYLRLDSQRASRRQRDAGDLYERQDSLLTRMQQQVDKVQEEMARRQVAETAAREENIGLRIQNYAFYALLEQQHEALQRAGIPTVPIPPKPIYAAPAAIKAEMEYVARTRQQDTDLLDAEVRSVKNDASQLKSKGGGK